MKLNSFYRRGAETQSFSGRNFSAPPRLRGEKSVERWLPKNEPQRRRDAEKTSKVEFAEAAGSGISEMNSAAFANSISASAPLRLCGEKSVERWLPKNEPQRRRDTEKRTRMEFAEATGSGISEMNSAAFASSIAASAPPRLRGEKNVERWLPKNEPQRRRDAEKTRKVEFAEAAGSGISEMNSAAFASSIAASAPLRLCGEKSVERWLPDMDLNHDKQIQSLLCYRYTIGQTSATKLDARRTESRFVALPSPIQPD